MFKLNEILNRTGFVVATAIAIVAGSITIFSVLYPKAPKELRSFAAYSLLVVCTYIALYLFYGILSIVRDGTSSISQTIAKETASIVLPKLEESMDPKQLGVAENIVSLLTPELEKTIQGPITTSIKQLDQSIAERVSRKIAPVIKHAIEESSYTWGSETSEFAEDQDAYLYLANRYGIGYDVLNIELSINIDGSCVIRRDASLIAFDAISVIDTYLHIVVRDPGVEYREPTVSSESGRRKIRIIEEKPEFGRHSAAIKFAPPVNVGEQETYTMVEYLDKKFLFAVGLSSRQLAERLQPFDYFSWTINRPSKQLVLRVFFPEIAKPEEYRGVVYYSSVSGIPSERTHHPEESLLRNPEWLETHGGLIPLQMVVQYPVVGLVYGIKWTPLAANS